MRIHQYANPTFPEPLSPDWLGRKCVHCDRISGLNDHQIRSMPVRMATCPKGKKLGILHVLVATVANRVNCLHNGRPN